MLKEGIRGTITSGRGLRSNWTAAARIVTRNAGNPSATPQTTPPPPPHGNRLARLPVTLCEVVDLTIAYCRRGRGPRCSLHSPVTGRRISSAGIMLAAGVILRLWREPAAFSVRCC